MCPMTGWIYIQEKCSCHVRIGPFQFFIDNWVYFQSRSIFVNSYEAHQRFTKLYWHLNELLPFLFPEHH